MRAKFDPANYSRYSFNRTTGEAYKKPGAGPHSGQVLPVRKQRGYLPHYRMTCDDGVRRYVSVDKILDRGAAPGWSVAPPEASQQWPELPGYAFTADGSVFIVARSEHPLKGPEPVPPVHTECGEVYPLRTAAGKVARATRSSLIDLFANA